MIDNILIGTYTKKDSKGIYSVQLDTEKKQLQDLELLVPTSNPTYLSVSSDNTLYSVVKDGEKGGLAKTDLSDTEIKVNKIASAPGTPPAYVSVDDKNKIVYDANYHEGTVHAYSQDLDVLGEFQNSGSGPKEEQDGSHLHYVDRTPDGHLVACDLGTDEVFILDFKDSKFTTLSTYHTEPGFGPRHIVFAPNKKIAYLAGELASQVEVLSYEENKFDHVQTVSTIPSDYSEHNGAAAIRIDSTGRFLYVSNRGFDSIAVFKIQTDYQLDLIQNISVEGSFPRDFAINPSEEFIVVANQNTDNLTLFGRNNEDGKLTLLQKDFHAPEGVCVYFN